MTASDCYSSAWTIWPLRMRRSKRAKNCHSTQTTTSEATTRAARATSAITGCTHDSQSMNGTALSPSSDSAMFENGSGDVLAEARIVSLVAWLVAASVPPISAAAVTQLAWSPPKTAAGQSRAGRDPDEGMDRVPDAVETRDLVDEELDEEHQPGGADDDRMGEHVQIAREMRSSPATRPSR